MNLFKKITILILFIIPISSIVYKNYVAHIDLIPSSATDKWNVSITYPFFKIAEKLGDDYLIENEILKLPFTKSTAFQKVSNFSLLDGSQHHYINKENSNFLEIPINELEGKTKLTALINVELDQAAKEKPLKSPRLPTESNEYIKSLLKLNMLSEDEREQLQLLNKKIIILQEDKIEVAKKIFFFVAEEITLDVNIDTITEALAHSSASGLVKAQLLTYLYRINGIPARLNVAYELDKAGQVTTLSQVYLPEILLNNEWFIISTDITPFDHKIKNFFVLYKNYDDFQKLFKKEFITVRAASVMVNQVDSVVYKHKLESVSSLFSLLSLHNLPVNVRGVFYTVLLIPLGTLVLAISRVLLGIKSFGIFTPILLSLFFLETSLGIGILFFTIIVLLGFGQRYMLDRLYLLAIPRLSVLLTLVIISYTFFSLIVYQNNGIFQVEQSLNYLPIVIITGFIERFSVHFIEEGTKNTVKALIGTLTISFLCYVIFKLEFLRQILFNNPELLLAIIACNLMIGSYKGYRLTEVMRFKEFEGINENV